MELEPPWEGLNFFAGDLNPARWAGLTWVRAFSPQNRDLFLDSPNLAHGVRTKKGQPPGWEAVLGELSRGTQTRDGVLGSDPVLGGAHVFADHRVRLGLGRGRGLRLGGGFGDQGYRGARAG